MTFSNIDHRPSTWPNSLPTWLCDWCQCMFFLVLVQISGHVEEFVGVTGSGSVNGGNQVRYAGGQFGDVQQ